MNVDGRVVTVGVDYILSGLWAVSHFLARPGPRFLPWDNHSVALPWRHGMAVQGARGNHVIAQCTVAQAFPMYVC